MSTYKQRERAHLGQLQDSGYFNDGEGRGFPDVAALATGYLTVIDGTMQTVHGTSAAAPVFASLVAMVNNERLRASKQPVGFVNPALYAHAGALKDVVTGASRGCGADPAFRAVEGWDAVTGLGTPDYERLRRVFMDLP